MKKNNTWDSNVVPHHSTNQARRCLTSLSRREAVLSTWYGRSCCTQVISTYTNRFTVRILGNGTYVEPFLEIIH
jgi:hypothetical protein